MDSRALFPPAGLSWIVVAFLCPRISARDLSKTRSVHGPDFSRGATTKWIGVSDPCLPAFNIPVRLFPCCVSFIFFPLTYSEPGGISIIVIDGYLYLSSYFSPFKNGGDISIDPPRCLSLHLFIKSIRSFFIHSIWRFLDSISQFITRICTQIDGRTDEDPWNWWTMRLW